MSHRIHLLPDDKSFDVEVHESILQAALRAGIPVDYNCSNGNCGLCKIKLLNGQVEATRNADYIFSQEEKQNNMLLSCANTAATDIEIEAAVAHDGCDVQEQNLTAKIKKLELVGDDLMVLHVKSPRSKRLRFLAGQYVLLTLADMEPYQAAVASCPCEDMRLEFHIRHLHGEAFSNYLFDEARVGQLIDIQGPRGEFILHDPSDRPLLMIAFDTGYAAIKSLMEHAFAMDEDRPVYFYWLNCGEQQPYMHKLLHALDDAMDNLSYRHLSLNAEYPDVAKELPGAKEMINNYLAVILNDIPDLTGFEAYVAAPLLIKELSREVLGRHGLLDEHIQVEPVHGNKDISCLI